MTVRHLATFAQGFTELVFRHGRPILSGAEVEGEVPLALRQ